MYIAKSSKTAFIKFKWLKVIFVNKDKNITVEEKRK